MRYDYKKIFALRSMLRRELPKTTSQNKVESLLDNLSYQDCQKMVCTIDKSNPTDIPTILKNWATEILRRNDPNKKASPDENPNKSALQNSDLPG